MTQVVTTTNGGNRLIVLLLEIFAILALLLVAIGIYGVIAFTVSQRTREIGIRLAVGARREAILRMVLKNGMKLAAIGLLVGLPLSAAIPHPATKNVSRANRRTHSGCACWRSCICHADRPCLDLSSGASGFQGRPYACVAL